MVSRHLSGDRTLARAGAASSCELRVGGMDCASCAATVERSLKALPGVADVQVDVMGGRVRIGFAGGTVARRELAGAIRRVGYSVDEAEGVEPGVARRLGPLLQQQRHRIALASAAGVTLGLALLAQWLGAAEQVQIGLLALSTLAGGWYVVPRGVRAARHLALDMNFLMSIAAAGAWLIGERGEAAATLFLFSVAELLESFSMDRARHAIQALMDLSPPEARRVRDGVEMMVPAASLEAGDVVRVRPGEKIPADGVVLAGASSVDQATITGESIPVDKEVDADVFAGTLNGHGLLEIRATKPSSDTTLARIIHAVEEAQATRAPSQAFVDRFARVYTPAVVILAILIAVLPPAFGIGGWEVWTYRALAMLVVACPCALVISTPVTIVSGLAGAARQGILIKGGVHLENAGSTNVVAFDKTGTLTEGRPQVVDLLPFAGESAAAVLRTAAAVERHSEHPLAHAVLLHAAQQGVDVPASEGFQALVGRGARARVDGHVVSIGNMRLARELGAATPEVERQAATGEAGGRTVILVMREGQALGMISIADRPRPDARHGVAALRQMGIQRILMLTGDNAGTAAAIAAQIGIDEVHAELLPEDKVRLVRSIEATGARVAFVGDGVNDAPALAAATVGIAMGAAGTDVALETADVALMSDDLTRIAAAIARSRRTRRIVRQNVWFSLAIKAVFLVLAGTGYAALWMAVAADMGGSLVVVANGLRARRA